MRRIRDPVSLCRTHILRLRTASPASGQTFGIRQEDTAGSCLLPTGYSNLKATSPMQSILGNTRKTDITFHAGGRIDISARVVKTLSLQKGDVIDVMDAGGEFYLYVKIHAPTVGRHEATCFPTHSRSCHFRAWSQKLCRALIKVGGASLCKVELSCGAPVDLTVGTALPIIYRHILNDDTRD